jgi:hypothetical protein
MTAGRPGLKPTGERKGERAGDCPAPPANPCAAIGKHNHQRGLKPAAATPRIIAAVLGGTRSLRSLLRFASPLRVCRLRMRRQARHKSRRRFTQKGYQSCSQSRSSGSQAKVRSSAHLRKSAFGKAAVFVSGSARQQSCWLSGVSVAQVRTSSIFIAASPPPYKSVCRL